MFPKCEEEVVSSSWGRDDFVEEEEHVYTLKNSSNLDRGGKSHKSEREKHISGRVNSLVGLFQMKV